MVDGSITPAPRAPNPPSRPLFKHTPPFPNRRSSNPGKHRAVVERPPSRTPKKALKTTLVLSAIAITGTGTAVAGGVALSGVSHGASSADATVTHPTVTPSSAAEVLRGRDQALSRSFKRVPVKPAVRKTPKHRAPVRPKHAAPPVKPHPVEHRTAAPAYVSSENPQQIASAMLSSYGWDSSQFSCLVSLWDRESGWRVNADNPSSGAYGIPQSLPGSKMASAGADWQTNPVTQIRWGLTYIQASYGTPCGAWAHSEATGWY